MLDHPESAADCERAAALIGDAFPSLRSKSVAFLDEGWDFRVFEVGGEWIFRFPKRHESVAKLDRELALLVALCPLLCAPLRSRQPFDCMASQPQQAVPHCCVAGYGFPYGSGSIAQQSRLWQ